MRTEFKTELENILRELRGKLDIKSEQTDTIFRLHNEYFHGTQEHGKSCGSCRSRVYKRLLSLLDSLEKQENN
jgi:hypothetical protein